ncbi:MAG TPA: hypothetical protein ENF51_00970 [Candidatus Aenigmarchaeota archaeon]|nr:hypothetical protein [Candidatus Aenigmarchaeota archaeon]
MRYLKLLREALASWKRNPKSSIPFLLQSLVISMYLFMLGLQDVTNITDEFVQRAMSSIPLLFSSFLIVLLLSSYFEAVGLGMIRYKRGMWKYGKRFWWSIFLINLLSFFIYLCVAVPLIFISILLIPFSMALIALSLLFSKYIAVHKDYDAVRSVKKSVKLFVKKPGVVLSSGVMVFAMVAPFTLLSVLSPHLFSLLAGVFLQPWSAYFLFSVCEKLVR